MYWIKAIEFQQVLRNFSMLEATLQIDSMIICHRLTSKGIPHSCRVCVF